MVSQCTPSFSFRRSRLVVGLTFSSYNVCVWTSHHTMCCHGCARQRLDGYGKPLRYKANGVGPLLNVFYSTPILRPASKSFYDTGTAAVELGLGHAACARPLVASIIKEYAVPNTISQAWYLGRAVHLARRSKTKTDRSHCECSVPS